MITILGTGLLGSAFARSLLKKGELVRVWNRTIARAQPLAEQGAIVVGDVAEAVRGVDRIHVVLGDDASVDSVLAAAAPGFAAGTFVFDHSTTSPAGARERTRTWRDRGITYVHAPLLGGPRNVAAGDGFFLVSGDRETVARVTPLLAAMIGNVLDVGERVEQAAAFKLLNNALLMTLGAGFRDIVALARSMGVAPRDVLTLFNAFNPAAALPQRYKRFTDAAYDDVSWDLAMARKDVGLMQTEADRAGIELRVLPALATSMDELIAEGNGERDWTIVGRDVVVTG